MKKSAIEMVNISYPVSIDAFQHEVGDSSPKKWEERQKKRTAIIQKVLEMGKRYYFEAVDFHGNFLTLSI